MNEKTKLILALTQVQNVANLVEGNEYETFLVSHLYPLKIEIERQLSLLNVRKETN